MRGKIQRKVNWNNLQHLPFSIFAASIKHYNPVTACLMLRKVSAWPAFPFPAFGHPHSVRQELIQQPYGMTLKYTTLFFLTGFPGCHKHSKRRPYVIKMPSSYYISHTDTHKQSMYVFKLGIKRKCG